MMMMSHPHPQSEFPSNKPLPLPHPPQQKSKIIIQMMELHPHLLLETLLPHPHPVAVKSLIVLPPKGFVYGLSYVTWLVCVSINEKIFKSFSGRGIIIESDNFLQRRKPEGGYVHEIIGTERRYSCQNTGL